MEAITKKRRPDGVNPEDYRGHEEWSTKRWAWEFLRRNERFLSECKRCDALQEEDEKLRLEDETAAEFGLSKYKSASAGFDRGEEPMFALARITRKARLKASDNEGYRRRMEVGDVVVVFRLSRATGADSIKKQISIAEAYLQRATRRLEKEEPERKRVKKIHRGLLITYLRVLDMRASKKPLAEIAMAVDQDGPKNSHLSRDDWRDKGESLYEQAFNYSDHGYLDLALKLAGKR